MPDKTASFVRNTHRRLEEPDLLPASGERNPRAADGQPRLSERCIRGVEDCRLGQDDPSGIETLAPLHEPGRKVAQRRSFSRFFLQIDQEDATVSDLREQVGLALARRLAVENSPAYVAEEAVLLANVGEVEVTMEGARRCFGDQEQVDSRRLVLLRGKLPTSPCLLALLGCLPRRRARGGSARCRARRWHCVLAGAYDDHASRDEVVEVGDHQTSWSVTKSVM